MGCKENNRRTIVLQKLLEVLLAELQLFGVAALEELDGLWGALHRVFWDYLRVHVYLIKK